MSDQTPSDQLADALNPDLATDPLGPPGSDRAAPEAPADTFGDVTGQTEAT